MEESNANVGASSDKPAGGSLGGQHPIEPRRERMTSMRRVISKRMSQSWSTAPMVTFNRRADVGALAELKDALSKDGNKISYTDLLVKLAAVALTSYPSVNSSVDGDDIIYHDYANIGVAVALENGLIVPVVKNAGEKSVAEISSDIKSLAEKARAGKLSLDEMSGGTFTITNLGMFGIESFSPIINQPENAILGVNAIMKTAVEIDGEIVMRPLMMLSLTADHRVVDGAVAAAFLQRLCELIESPQEVGVL